MDLGYQRTSGLLCIMPEICERIYLIQSQTAQHN